MCIEKIREFQVLAVAVLDKELFALKNHHHNLMFMMPFHTNHTAAS